MSLVILHSEQLELILELIVLFVDFFLVVFKKNVIESSGFGCYSKEYVSDMNLLQI